MKCLMYYQHCWPHQQRSNKISQSYVALVTRNKEFINRYILFNHHVLNMVYHRDENQIYIIDLYCNLDIEYKTLNVNKDLGRSAIKRLFDVYALSFLKCE